MSEPAVPFPAHVVRIRREPERTSCRRCKEPVWYVRFGNASAILVEPDAASSGTATTLWKEHACKPR